MAGDIVAGCRSGVSSGIESSDLDVRSVLEPRSGHKPGGCDRAKAGFGVGEGLVEVIHSDGHRVGDRWRDHVIVGDRIVVHMDRSNLEIPRIDIGLSYRDGLVALAQARALREAVLLIKRRS